MNLDKMYDGIAYSPPTELAQPISDSATSIEVVDISAFPPAPSIAVIGVDENGETVIYNSVSGNTLNGVVRGVQGAARAWNAGSVIARNFTWLDHKALIRNINTVADTQTTYTTGGNEPSYTLDVPWVASLNDLTGKKLFVRFHAYNTAWDIAKLNVSGTGALPIYAADSVYAQLRSLADGTIADGSVWIVECTGTAYVLVSSKTGLVNGQTAGTVNISMLARAGIWCGTAGGAYDDYNLTSGHSLAALAEGYKFSFYVASRVSSAPIIKIDNLAAYPLNGEINPPSGGAVYTVVYRQNAFFLSSGGTAPSTGNAVHLQVPAEMDGPQLVFPKDGIPSEKVLTIAHVDFAAENLVMIWRDQHMGDALMTFNDYGQPQDVGLEEASSNWSISIPNNAGPSSGATFMLDIVLEN